MSLKEFRIRYLQDEDENKYMPWQYYNLYDMVSIPIIGKRPFLKNWTDIKQTVHPSYINQNVGIITGKTSGITVIDIDVKDNGVEFWKELIKDRRINVPIVRTPSGGLHYYFKYNDKLKTTIRLNIDNRKIGIDVKNNNSMVVAPPSSSDGKYYRWLVSPSHTSIKQMPVWLEKFILEKSSK